MNSVLFAVARIVVAGIAIAIAMLLPNIFPSLLKMDLVTIYGIAVLTTIVAYGIIIIMIVPEPIVDWVNKMRNKK